MIELKDWSNQLGLMPIPFQHNQSQDIHRYAMLNGVRYNFCLDYESDSAIDIARNDIWSANMSHYVIAGANGIDLYNYRNEKPETISYRLLRDNLEKFYEYLSKKESSLTNSVLDFVLSEFRIVRSNLREEPSASDSLKVFLALLSKLSEKPKEMYVPEGTDSAVSRVEKAIFDQVVDELKNTAPYGLKLNVSLILRHCAGALFQEANYLARFSPQLELFPSGQFLIENNPREMGSFYTPSYIARSIVEEAFRFYNFEACHDLTIFDPACGSGVFLAEALRQLKTKSFKGKVKVIGWDISSEAADLAQYVLQFEKTEWLDNTLEIECEVIDSLSLDQWPQADFIFMNPPFKSWYLMNAFERNQALSIVGEHISRPNLAALFYYKASFSLNSSGRLGALLPQSFLNSDSFKAVRRKTSEALTPSLICNLGSYVFQSAMADVCIVIASNCHHEYVQMMWTRNVSDVPSNALRSLRMVNNGIMPNKYDSNLNIYCEELQTLISKDIWTPLSAESMKLRRVISERDGLIEACSLFDIRMGARTGANDVFCLNLGQYKNLPKRERCFFRPSVDNASINAGQLSEVNYVFYPYGNYASLLETEDDLQREIPFYYHEFLLRNKERLSRRSKIDPNKWWLLTWPRNWQFENKPKLVSTEFGHAGSFSIDTTGRFAVERGMAWLPKNNSLGIEQWYAFVALFSSPLFDHLLDLYSRQLAGGVFNLEAKYVGHIRIPDFGIPTDITRILCDYGKRIVSKGMKDIDIDALNAIVLNLYGL